MNKVGSLKVDGEQRPKLVQALPDGTVVSSTDTLPTPPDGGWGWMVVFSTFMVHVIVCGIPNSFGIFLIAFIEQFDAGRGNAGWISSLVAGMMLCSGPIVSTLTNKYGCRVVSNAGSILAAFGFVISVFAPNLYYLYFSFGIVSGFGLGMLFLPAVVSVTHYFQKRRSFATGVALCGAGIGTIILTPLSDALIEEYGWRGATLIEAGLILNGCICGFLLRPLELKKQAKRKPFTVSVNKDSLDGATAKDGAAVVVAPKDYSSAEGLEHHGATVRRNGNEGGSSGDIDVDRSNPVAHSHSLTSPHRQVAPQDERSLFCLCYCSEETKGTFQQMTELFKDVIFLLFAVPEFFTFLGYYVPFFYLPDRVEQLGVSKLNAAFLISVIGVSDTIARGFFGLLAGIECVNPLYLRSTALTLCGISTFLSIFCFNYEMFVVYAVFFGGCSGVSVCLAPVVLVNLLGTEQFTNAFGLLILFQGVATIVGPPMAGWLYDLTHSYDLPFAIVGAVTTCSGLILYSVPCVQRLCQRRRRQRLEQDNVSTEHGLSLSVRDA